MINAEREPGFLSAFFFVFDASMVESKATLRGDEEASAENFNPV